MTLLFIGLYFISSTVSGKSFPHGTTGTMMFIYSVHITCGQLNDLSSVSVRRLKTIRPLLFAVTWKHLFMDLVVLVDNFFWAGKLWKLLQVLCRLNDKGIRDKHANVHIQKLKVIVFSPFCFLYWLFFKNRGIKKICAVVFSFASLKMKPLFPLFHMPLFHMFHTLEWYIDGRNGKKTAMQWNFNQRLLLL